LLRTDLTDPSTICDLISMYTASRSISTFTAFAFAFAFDFTFTAWRLRLRSRPPRSTPRQSRIQKRHKRLHLLRHSDQIDIVRALNPLR
jgi:hypothetical protein